MSRPSEVLRRNPTLREEFRAHHTSFVAGVSKDWAGVPGFRGEREPQYEHR